MKKFNLITRFLLSLIMLFIVGCAGSKVSESTGEYFDDTIITSKVKSGLLSNSRIRSADITVTTFKGIVQLSGFVNSKAVADTAVDIARKVSVVKAVNNSLVIK